VRARTPVQLLSVVVATPSLTYNATPTPPRRGRGPACRLVGVASLDPERWKRAHPEFCRQTGIGWPRRPPGARWRWTG